MTNPQAGQREQRVVRVFVSSTFKDMMAEREELVKFVFPELRRRCRERRVEFVGVDLRWGITEEQAAKGEVLPICLAEIEGCRPYFIGLLGERYGWVPETIDDEAVASRPWLTDHRTKSVTELEILHGVLNDPAMQGLAFFYFRDRNASRAIEERLSHEPSYAPEPGPSQDKLADLKGKIETSGYPLRKDYPDEKALGQWIIEDLWAAIDQRFPLGGVPTELEQQRMDHDAFAALRREVYIGRDEYVRRLNDHAASDGPPLVILGDSGSGKSALLANWITTYQEQHPQTLVITHYIGSTADSADHVAMLRRIMEEIRDRLAPKGDTEEAGPALASRTRDDEEIPSDPEKVVEAFPLWLARAVSQGPLVLILDALNQLEDRDNAPDLTWLPWSFSPRVRLIVSTLPGRCLDALQTRGWPTLTMQPMETGEQKRYITHYLGKYRKGLEAPRVEKIVEAPQTKNPLYLRTLLEELRVFGVYEALDARIDHYLKATTVDRLFALVLERLEADYEKERPGLVKEVTALIWASRRGLSETELLELLGTPENPMPRALWSPLYLALEDSLVGRSGLLTFFHDFLRQAVEERYLPAPEDKKEAHRTLADYFDTKPLDDRKVDELPWQHCAAEAWGRLKDCVTDMDMFLNLRTDAREYELTGYWLAMAPSHDMADGYHRMIARYEDTAPDQADLADRLIATASFLRLNARHDGAEPLYRRALAIREKVLGPEHPDTASSLYNLAWLLRDKGDYDGAEPLYRRGLAIWEKVLGAEHPSTSASLNNLAWLLENKGDYDGAERLHRRALAIYEKVLGPEHPNTAHSLDNLGVVLERKGDYDEAETLHRKALTIREKVLGPNHPDTANSLNNLAALLDSKGDYPGAEPLYRRALAILEKVLGPEHPLPAVAMNNLARLLMLRRDYDGAEPLYRRALAIWEKVLGPEHPDAAHMLSNLAELLKWKGDYDEAETFHRRALTLREKVLGPEHHFTARSLYYVGDLLYDRGDYDGADPLLRRALLIEKKILGPDNDETVMTTRKLLQIALQFRDRGDQEKAAQLYGLALGAYEETSDRVREKAPEIASNMATCHNELALHTAVPAKRWKEAENHYRRAIELFHTASDKVNGADVELNLQTLHQLSGQPVDRFKVEESTRILEEAGDQRAEKGHRLLKGL
jgi:nephrocystin-3